MDTPGGMTGAPGADRCAEQRSAVTARCEAASQAQRAHLAVTEQVRELRRRQVDAERDVAVSQAAADPELRRGEKARVRELYERALVSAESDAERTEAVAHWLRALDRINRSSNLARRAVDKARGRLKHIEAEAHEAGQHERSSRMTAEAEEAACLDARVRLASCQEHLDAPTTEDTVASPFAPYAATAGHAAAVPALRRTEPLVIESMVSDDRRALELAAAAVAEHTDLLPAQAKLQLQELVDAIVSAASSDGYLIFESDHPFWSYLSVEEAGDVVAALARLGFQFEPAEGWHAGRSPTPMDLSMALAYAGLDARNMRDLPTREDLRRLPESISVDARGFLAREAPDLAVDQLVGVLGRRAKPLEPLWDTWGQIRPILLSDRRSLGRSEG